MAAPKLATRFNDERADAAVAFFERRLHLTEGRWSGVPFTLPDWQRDDIVRPLFGWERHDPEVEGQPRPDGTTHDGWVRLYRKAWIEVPKKNGKSPLGAGLALQGLLADGEEAPQVFSIAAGKRQAGIVFNVAADMVEMEPALRRRATINRSRVAHHGVIYTARTRGVYRVIPGDADADDGINPSRVVVDEVHRIQNRGIIDLLDESLAARLEPLIVYITTAGVDDPMTIAWELHDHAEKVLAGVVQDPYFFAYILGATREETEGDGWRNEDLWRRTNPAIESFNPSMLTDLRAAAAQAEVSPVKIANFKRLRLNVWLPPSVTNQHRLVDLLAWDRSAGLIDHTALSGREVYGGLDMASSEDLAALAGAFPNQGCRNGWCNAETCYDVIFRFWLPAAVLHGEGSTWTKGLLTTVQGWVADGWITVVDGEVIDDRDIHAVVDEWRRDYELVELAKDPYQSKQLGVELDEEGLVVYDHGQTMIRMAEPTERFIGHVRSKRIHHGGNPVARWMIGNAVAKTDGYGNKRPDRKTSTGKIDGIVAAILAVAAAERQEGGDVFGFTIGGTA